MASNVAIPSLGESVSEATVLTWLKEEGDQVAVDEPLCELESDKATVDLPAPASGILHQIKRAGETARIGEVIAQIDPAPNAAKPAEPPKAPKEQQPAKEPARQEAPPQKQAPPPAEKLPEPRAELAPPKSPPPPPVEPKRQPAPPSAAVATDGARRVPMTRIRRGIAERLVRAQQTAAMLTTFNEIDMSEVLALRKRHQERFQEIHGVPLGLMSFFARACVLALKHFPDLNAQIEQGDILYHDHVHLGIAVSTDRGLVVPVLRHVERMSFAQIEGEIKRAAAAAREGKLSLEELSGGTFTITNGGVFGSLLSTPILNPPQTGILGMHVIQERPVAVQAKVEIRPMMYVALTYDHRLVDGKDSVSFLVRLKKLLEDPMQMILEI